MSSTGASVAWVFILLLGWITARDVTRAAPVATRHAGMANASAGVAAGPDHFAAASDEDNRLRVYRLDRSGPAVSELDLSPYLALSGRSREVDIEGAAAVGDLLFWAGSHGSNKDGRFRPNRHRLFATRLLTNGAVPRLEFYGRYHAGLVTELLRLPEAASLGLRGAATRAPEDGGINIEGLAATPAGGLMLGFRSPLKDDRAVLVPLLNPREAVDGKGARFGPAVLLDLGGLGVRDFVWTGREYFLIAGRVGSGGRARLYRWSGTLGDAAVRVEHAGFHDFNPEALVFFGTPEAPRLLTLSDDGHRDNTTPQFRSFWVEP